jgi:hypothetical protein
MLRRMLLAAVCVLGLGSATVEARSETRPVTRPAAAAPAPRVAYLLDASGSMIPHLADAVKEVAKALDGLAEGQEFAIVVAQDGRAFELVKWSRASDATRDAAWQELKGLITSSTDGIVPAFELLAKLKPDVVWLISDGDFNDNMKIRNASRAHQKAAPFKLNAIARYMEPERVDFVVSLCHERGGRCYGDDGQPIAPPLPPAPPPPSDRPKGPSVIKN